MRALHLWELIAITLGTEALRVVTGLKFYRRTISSIVDDLYGPGRSKN